MTIQMNRAPPINTASDNTRPPRAVFDRLLADLRPKLHRYCARMTGSVIDGEDVVQDALVKALEAYDRAGPTANAEGWLFRIAHNAALDFLRRRARLAAIHSDEDTDMVPDPISSIDDRQIVTTSLRNFMQLPVTQRSSVILMDVLGYSLDDIRTVTGGKIAAIKTAVRRGRIRLRELARAGDEQPVPVLPEPERALLAAYVARFNARDFDAIRDMLAEEVRLDLVSRKRAHGRSEVSHYFHRYGEAQGWHLVPGFVDRRPAILVYNPDDPSGRLSYFILLEWAAGHVLSIRDFAHARYVIDGADVRRLG
jgi:RNA polymerase sigma-70 factor (ECF subfamily)